MQLSEPFSISPFLCFVQSSPCSPCSPGDTTIVPHSFSPRNESQAGQHNQDHSEKVLLNLEEVKASGRRVPTTVNFTCLCGVDLLKRLDAAD